MLRVFPIWKLCGTWLVMRCMNAMLLRVPPWSYPSPCVYVCVCLCVCNGEWRREREREAIAINEGVRIGWELLKIPSFFGESFWGMPADTWIHEWNHHHTHMYGVVVEWVSAACGGPTASSSKSFQIETPWALGAQALASRCHTHTLYVWLDPDRTGPVGPRKHNRRRGEGEASLWLTVGYQCSHTFIY